MPDIAGIAQAGLGALQTIGGWFGAKKAQRQLKNLKTPTYGGSSSITDYYNQALQRANTNPYQSAEYQMNQRNAERATATGLNALNSRRSAVGGVSRLVGLQNDASLKAAAAAENDGNQKFNQLGNAVGMKTDDDRMKFQYNQIAPYEKQYNLLSAKAGGANQTANAGISNIFGGLGSISNYAKIKQMYK